MQYNDRNPDQRWMQRAYEWALQAKETGDVPVGAVLVSEDQQYLAGAGNQVFSQKNPCAHAEMLVIQTAARELGQVRLLNTTLYVTLEPCAMCAAAMVHARIKRLVFASRDFKAGAAGSVLQLLKGYPLNHLVQVDEGVMAFETSRLLSQFFENRRRALE